MSLRSVKIAPVRRFSFKPVTTPAVKVIVVPEEVLQDPYTHVEEPTLNPPKGLLDSEEVAYSKLIAINPLLEDLVKSLDLVSRATGEPIALVEGNFPSQSKQRKKPAYNPKLKAVAGKIIEGEKSYTREELISKIAEGTKTPQERAENGFNLMVEQGIIKYIKKTELYYLGGSTPF